MLLHKLQIRRRKVYLPAEGAEAVKKFLVITETVCAAVPFKEKDPRTGAGLWGLCLFSLGSLNRAGSCTGTAVDASVSIDSCLCVVHSDSTYRTCVNTSAAADAFFTDRICHNNNLLLLLLSGPIPVPNTIITHFCKNARPFLNFLYFSHIYHL